MCRILSSKFIKLIFGIFFLFLTPKLVSASEYIPRGYFVIDLKNKIEWMTCPVGMVWNKKTCNGTAKKYELKFLPDIINIANKQLEGSWRLPTRKELESLICIKCEKVKINLKIFPKTPPEPSPNLPKSIQKPSGNDNKRNFEASCEKKCKQIAKKMRTWSQLGGAQDEKLR